MSASINPTRRTTSKFRNGGRGIRLPRGTAGVLWIPPLVFASIFFHLPRLLRYRFFRRKPADPQNLHIVLFSDNIDEVNGIANNSRQVVAHQLSKGHQIYLVGTVFHTRDTGVVEDGFTFLLPQYFSMEQLGYPDSELAAPSLGAALRLVERFRPDLVELQTPALGAWLIMLACKVMGIRVISHYRTDVLGYARLLVAGDMMNRYIAMWMHLFSWLTTPVVSPSRDFSQKIHRELGLAAHKIVLLPRGIRTEAFDPALHVPESWSSWFPEGRTGTRFVFVGRISKEKALPFLEDVWRTYRESHGNAQFLVVGHGPYLAEMQQRMSDCPEFRFAGQQSGLAIAQAYAGADWLVFPSGTDTFGNVVVEALASGTPAVVSDRGGPKDIVEDSPAGKVVPFLDKVAWLSALEEATSLVESEQWSTLRSAAWERSRTYTLDSVCEVQWKFFQSLFP